MILVLSYAWVSENGFRVTALYGRNVEQRDLKLFFNVLRKRCLGPAWYGHCVRVVLTVGLCCTLSPEQVVLLLLSIDVFP